MKHTMLPSSAQPSTSKHCVRYHSHRVWGRTFNIEDLVLRLVQSNKNCHKLSPPWEGLYVVMKVLRLGTYKFKTIDDKVFINA